MMADLVVIQLDRARTALVEARTLSQVKSILDIAAAAKVYAQRQKLGDEAVRYATEISLDAERKLGQMLRETPKNAGARGIGVSGVPPEYPTIAELGIDKKTSARAQRLADLAEDDFQAVKAGEVKRMQAFRDQRAQEIRKEVTAPTAKYRVLYADPPWSYGNTQPDYHTEQRDHYPVMALADICALPVSEWVEPNSVLFLWVTSPILEESFQVVNAWGFRYKSSFVWDKIKHNMGHYNSVRHEFLLICTRGSGMPDVPKLFDSVVAIERGAHSEKPAVFYEMIETLYPHGKRLEMFARGQRAGWDHYGNEADATCAA